MLSIYYNESFNMNHEHVENHDRIIKSVKHLKKKFKNFNIYNSTYINNNLKELHGIQNIEQIAIDFLKNVCNHDFLDDIKKKCNELCFDDIVDGDTYFSRITYNEIIDCACIMHDICNEINNKNIKYAYALIRPPSHHSQLNYYNGFCFVNQTYQTAKYLHDKFDKKVFILDYDLHHGDGTQSLVKKNIDDDIYFCSIHCYAPGFYPGTGSEDENNNKVLNIPMPKRCDDETYITKFNEKIIPFIKESKCDIIVISNGLDAHKDDPMSIMNLTRKYYIYVSKYLKTLDIPLIYILEGGYNPKTIGDISEDIINVLK